MSITSVSSVAVGLPIELNDMLLLGAHCLFRFRGFCPFHYFHYCSLMSFYYFHCCVRRPIVANAVSQCVKFIPPLLCVKFIGPDLCFFITLLSFPPYFLLSFLSFRYLCYVIFCSCHSLLFKNFFFVCFVPLPFVSFVLLSVIIFSFVIFFVCNLPGLCVSCFSHPVRSLSRHV